MTLPNASGEKGVWPGFPEVGEMAALVRAYDWSTTSLGPIETWPQSLKTAVDLMLSSRQPVYVAWGAELTSLYNDGYIPIVGAKHPTSLGQPFDELWSEIREEYRPLVEAVMGGEALHFVDRPAALAGRDGVEIGYFTFSWTPLRDEAGIIRGFICNGLETTERVEASRAFRRMFEASPSPFLVLAPDAPKFTIVEVKDAYLTAVMRSREDLLGRGVFEALPDNPDDPGATGVANLRASLERAIATKRPDTMPRQQYDIPHPNGGFEVRWWDPVNSPLLGVGGEVEALIHHVVDVTEEHKAAERLRASEERQRFLLALGDRLRSLTDPNDVVLAAAEMLGRHLGVSRAGYGELDRAGELIRVERDWSDGVPSLAGEARLLDGFGPAIAEELRAGRTLRVNDSSTDPRATGRGVAEAWASIGVRAIVAVPLIKAGRFAAFLYLHEAQPRVWTDEEVGLAEEVAERSWDAVERARAEAALRANERELRRSEERLQLATQAAGVGIWDWDLVTDDITWSAEMFELLGVDPATPAEQLYSTWADTLIPEERAEYEPLVLQTAREGGSFSFDFRRAAAKGESRWIRSQGVAVLGPNGKPVRFTGVNLDVTSQRLEEERLRHAAEALALMVEERTRERDRFWRHSLDLLSVIDLDSAAFDAVNPAWTSALGWAVEQLEGHRFAEFVHPGDVRASAAAFEQVQQGDPVLRFENRYRTLRGEWRWLSWVAVPEGGKLYSITRDVTEEKERQAELEAAQAALRQSQKMEAMGQLTGGVAHDFNNLLTPIFGALDVLQRKQVGGEREQRLIFGAMQSAERAKILVQRLLAFARRQPLQPTSVDLSKLVGGMAELVASTTGPQIKVVVDAPENLPPAMGDANQLEMALLNLAVNARDAMGEGGTLRISASAEDVRAGHGSGLRPGAYVKLSVADTGAGMDEATLARAVEPFFSTKGVGKGTGLGLSMVHGLASQLGGALTISSRPGLGTNVELWLPRGTQVADDAERGAQSIVTPKLRGAALLVDDEELVRVSTADMLSELGYAVIEAASGEEALRLIEEGRPFDLLVTDHLMPGITGADLANAVRSTRPSVPVLLVSGYAEREGIAPDLPRLTKPFRKEDLASSLAQICEQS